jgi:hypothetical protein
MKGNVKKNIWQICVLICAIVLCVGVIVLGGASLKGDSNKTLQTKIEHETTFQEKIMGVDSACDVFALNAAITSPTVVSSGKSKSSGGVITLIVVLALSIIIVAVLIVMGCKKTNVPQKSAATGNRQVEQPQKTEFKEETKKTDEKLSRASLLTEKTQASKVEKICVSSSTRTGTKNSATTSKK